MDSISCSDSVVQRSNPVGSQGRVHTMIRTVIGTLVGALVIVPVTYMSADREPPFVRLPESRIIPFDVRSEQTFDVHWELYVKCLFRTHVEWNNPAFWQTHKR